MPKVTAIKLQKKKERVNVYLDGGFAFGIDLDNLVKFGIKVEKEFSQEEIDKIVDEAEFVKTYNKLLKFATLRPRSHHELENWLRRKKVTEPLKKKLFNRLKSLDLVDDEKFAFWWVEQRNNFRPRSRRQISYELRLKGIEKGIIKEALQKVDDIQVARKLVEKRKYLWQSLPAKKRQKKIYEFLTRRGFDWGTIKSVKLGLEQGKNE